MDRPSVSTPLLRRFFGNEARREQEETRALYLALAAQPNPYTAIELGAQVYAEYVDSLTEEMRSPFIDALDAVITAERYMFECPPPAAAMTLKEFADYRNFLR